MSAPAGSLGWLDLTVADPDRLLEFYRRVLGWKSEPVAMQGPEGPYHDHLLLDDAGRPVAGLCHARGANLGVPPVWLAYIHVADLERALEAVRQGGGRLLHGPRGAGGGRMAVIQDPSGAHLALYQA